MKKQAAVSLESLLSPNETVLWEGKPEKMKTMERPHGLALLLRWALCAALAIAVLYYWFVLSTALSLPQGRVAATSIMFLALLVYLCIAPLLAKDHLEKKARYCITNRRIIIYRLDTTYTLVRDLKDITEAHVQTLSTGMSNLVFGPYNSFIKRHLRDDVLAFVGTWKMEPLPFTSIMDVEGACAALPQHIKVQSDRPLTVASKLSGVA